MKNQLVQIVKNVLKENKISFDAKELDFQIKSHPSYPSLHAITGVLHHFNIENMAAKVNVDEATLAQLPSSFIAQLSETKGNTLATVVKQKQHYSIFDGIHKATTITKEAFLKKFTGIIVAVEKNEASETKTENITTSSFLPLLFLAFLFGYFSLNTRFDLVEKIVSLLSLVGIIISWVIIQQEMGIQTKIGQTFCSDGPKQKDCNAVLTSKGARIFQYAKLSDLSFIYFTFLFLATFIIPEGFQILKLISIIVLPIIIYSVYYQYYVVKSWCALCLTIAAIILSQGIISYLNGISIIDFDFVLALPLGLLYGVLLFSWKYTRPYIEEIIKLRNEKIKAVKFQRNYTLFEMLLLGSEPIATEIDAEEIVYGNPNAALELVIITNPFCGFCKPVHQTVDKILRNYQDDVKIVVRFNVNLRNLDANTVTVTRRLIDIYKSKGQETSFEAMNDIYGTMDANEWLLKWENDADNENNITILEQQKNWCDENSINFTPQILINGYAFPKEYNKEELFFFVEDLVNSEKIKSPKQKVLG